MPAGVGEPQLRTRMRALLPGDQPHPFGQDGRESMPVTSATRAPWRVCAHLKAAGHDAVHVSEIGLASADDRDVAARARG